MRERLLYLVRHAEVTLRGDVSPTVWQLTPEGTQQARELARAAAWGELTLIASSPESKAVATAQPIAEAAGLALRIEPALHEVDRGTTPIMSTPEYQALVAAYFERASGLDGWEPAADARSRVVACIESLAAEAEGSLCVVSHGLILSHFLAHLRGLPAPVLEEWRAIPLPGVAVVDLASRRQVAPFESVNTFLART